MRTGRLSGKALLRYPRKGDMLPRGHGSAIDIKRIFDASIGRARFAIAPGANHGAIVGVNGKVWLWVMRGRCAMMLARRQ